MHALTPLLSHFKLIKQDPWFGTNIPPTALTLNDRYLRLAPPRRQTDADVKTVVDAIDPPASAASCNMTAGASLNVTAGASGLTAGSRASDAEAPAGGWE